MAGFFERLQKHNRLEESNAPEFLRTHPVTFKRIADAQARVADLPYRQTPDSADFLFVREKARGLQMTPSDAVEFYRKTLAEKRYGNEAAHRYGFAHALYLARDYDGAWQALQQARAVYKPGHAALNFWPAASGSRSSAATRLWRSSTRRSDSFRRAARWSTAASTR